jgi:murein DD-endopeptidase MepM/ murein hydrolase activator NlpD
LFSRKKKYQFNTEALNFVEVKRSAGKRLLRCLAFAVYINLFAFLFLIGLYSFVDSPEVRIQKLRILKYTQKYSSLNYKVDSISSLLLEGHFVYDQLYRNILEMDSLPKSFRTAGVGGYDPYAAPMNNYSNHMFSDLIMRIDNLKRQIRIQDESYDEILLASLDKNKKLKHFPGITPVKCDDNIWISSYFGSRNDPFTLNLKMHMGVDFVGPKNSNIHSTADGIVTLIKYSRRGYGNEIVIDHGFGYCTRYAHLNKVLVKVGEEVERGHLIGLMGNSGRSTGTHLHYEVWFNNNPINPIIFFNDDLSPDEFDQLAKKQTN